AGAADGHDHAVRHRLAGVVVEVGGVGQVDAGGEGGQEAGRPGGVGDGEVEGDRQEAGGGKAHLAGDLDVDIAAGAEGVAVRRRAGPRHGTGAGVEGRRPGVDEPHRGNRLVAPRGSGRDHGGVVPGDVEQDVGGASEVVHGNL